MTTKFKSFKNEEDVKRFFESRLSISVSTSSDVLSLLKELDLKRANQITRGEYPRDPNSVFNRYDLTIVSEAPAAPTLLVFANIWLLHFYFNGDKLAQISVNLSSIGL